MTTRSPSSAAVADAIRDVFSQPFDGEPQTITEAVGYIRGGLARIANAISPDKGPGTDANGGTVESLTEAVMGVTAGLFAIARALEGIAEGMTRE